MVHLKSAVVDVVNTYAAKGLKAVAISSNSTQTHPQDGPEAMAQDAKVRQKRLGTVLSVVQWPRTSRYGTSSRARCLIPAHTRRRVGGKHASCDQE